MLDCNFSNTLMPKYKHCSKVLNQSGNHIPTTVCTQTSISHLGIQTVLLF